jgi:hypothetical protein
MASKTKKKRQALSDTQNETHKVRTKEKNLCAGSVIKHPLAKYNPC